MEHPFFLGLAFVSPFLAGYAAYQFGCLIWRRRGYPEIGK